MGRLTIFAKGNVDVRDTLHVCRHGGEIVWNGVNEILRDRFPSCVARVRHETWTRSDALVRAGGQVPADLVAQGPPLGAYSAASQFSRALFDTPSDVVVLSIQPDVTQQLARHRHEGYLLFPHQFSEWPPEARAWLRRSFEPAGLLEPEESMANIADIITALRARSAPRILVYNLSAVVPGDRIHDHHGLAEDLSTRIRRFNLALVELSRRVGFSIVDVDAVVARQGAERLKLDAMHLTGEGCRAVAGEVVRVLEDLGALPVEEGGQSRSA